MIIWIAHLGSYLLLVKVVLTTILIAIASDYYMDIIEEADCEWAFGKARLVQSINQKLSPPSPQIIIYLAGKIFMNMFKLMKTIGKTRH